MKSIPTSKWASPQKLVIMSYQLVHLISFGANRKEYQKTANRLRSRVEFLSAGMVDKSSSTKAELQSLVVSMIEILVQAYPQAGPLLTYLSAQAHGRRSAMGEVRFAGKQADSAELWRMVSRLIPDKPAVSTDETNRRKASSEMLRTKAVLDRTRLTAGLSSVAMNSLWTDTISALRSKANGWTPEQALRLQDALYAFCSSRQGREQLEAKLSQYWPAKRASDWKPESALLFQVSLDPMEMTRLPEIAKLLAHPLAGHDGKVPMAQIHRSMEATATFTHDQDPVQIGVGLMVQVKELARKRLRDLNDEQRRRTASNEKRKQDEVVEQLRTLPAGLREALKKNPDLLNQV